MKHIVLLWLVATILLPLNGFAQKNTTPNSLLWQISGNGLPHNAYLFGTMHVKDKRVFDFSKNMTTAFDTCKAFAMEIALEPDIYKDIFKMMVADKDYRMEDYLKPEELQKLDNFLKKEFGFKLELFKQIKPVFLYIIMSGTGMSVDNEHFLDEHLFLQAKQKGKTIVGIETLEEQIKALDGLSIREQLDLVLDAVDSFGKNKKLEQKLLKYYQKQQLSEIAKLIEETSNAKITELLLTKRNYVMADRISKLVQRESVFIAIGAGHLPGKEGVIELLRKKGYTVEPVY
ncbi:TraB/GumN family protein [soil metagenome]